MQINKSTLAILKNFSKISKLYFEIDDEKCIKVSDISQNIISFYVPSSNDFFVNIPHMATDDLESFVNILSKCSDNAEITYTTTDVEYEEYGMLKKDTIIEHINIKDGDSFTKIAMSNPHDIRPFKDGLIMASDTIAYATQNSIFDFVITKDQIKSLIDASKNLDVKNFRIGMFNNKFSILAVNAKNDASDVFGIEITKDLVIKDVTKSFIFDINFLPYLQPGDYKVHVCDGPVVTFDFIIGDGMEMRYCYNFAGEDYNFNTVWG